MTFWLKPSGWVEPWLCAKLCFTCFTYMDLKQNPLVGSINYLHVAYGKAEVEGAEGYPRSPSEGY